MNKSFLNVLHEKPNSKKGYLKKHNFLPMISYRRYFVLDPDYGTFTRYKT